MIPPGVDLKCDTFFDHLTLTDRLLGFQNHSR